MTADCASTPWPRSSSSTQIAALVAAGYEGPVSFEVFAREVHDIDDPVPAIGVSMESIRARLAAIA